MHEEEEDEYLDEDGSKITVIQIVPASTGVGVSPGSQPDLHRGSGGDRPEHENSALGERHSLEAPNTSGSYEEVMASAVEEMEFRRRGQIQQQHQ